MTEKEGITTASGKPGAAIDPLYAATKRCGSVTRMLTRIVANAQRAADALWARAGAGWP